MTGTRSMRSVLSCTMAFGLLTPLALANVAQDVDLTPRLLADTVAGSASGMNTTAVIASARGQAFFRAANSGGPYMLWRSSGRPGGTFAVPGTDGIAIDPIAIPGTSMLLMFTGSGTLRTLLSVDASSLGVQQLSAGATFSLAGTATAQPGGVVAMTSPTFAMAGSKALFLAPVGGVNTLWATDGKASGTGPIIDPALGLIGNITPAGAYVYFTTRSTTNVYTLWRTDGTPMNPTRVADLRGAPVWTVESSGLRGIGNRVLFMQTVPGNTSVSEVWVSDGTPEGTHAVAQTPPQSSILAFPNDGAGLYSTRLTNASMEMWRLSPTASECVNLLNFARATQFVSMGTYGQMSMFGDTGGSQYNTNTNNALTIWFTDGTAQNTLGIPGFPGVPPTQAGATPNLMSRDILYVDSAVGGSGHEPWAVNLTTGSVGVLRDIIPGGGSSFPTKFFGLDGSHGAGFMAYDTPGHYALYTSDGTPEGTRLVSRMSGVPNQYSLKSIGSRVFFIGSGSSGVEPYAIDLCPGDYDNSGSVSIDDLFEYLADWFIASPDADVDDVRGAPTMNDLMTFFNAWMQPCAR